MGQAGARHARGAFLRAVLPGIALVAMVLAAYLPAFRAGFIWDDNDYVTENPTLRTADGLRRIWLEPGAVPQYYPLVHTAFWVEYHLWRDWACGYHVVNVLLHACSAILLWVVLRRLKVPGAWLAGAIFAVHPVNVESVAWITERKNVLHAAFYLAAMLAHLRFSLPEAEGNRGRRRVLYGLSLGLFLCAMLSKTVAVTFPAAVLLLIWWKRGRLGRWDLARSVPFFLVGIPLGLLTVWLEKTHVGAVGGEWSLGPVERVLVAGRALWFYAGKLLWPAGLSFIYPRWTVQGGVWWQYLYPAGALGAMGLLWALRKRIGRGPLVGVLFFAGTLVPAMGFFDVFPMRYSFVADHFQYLAGIGLMGLLTAWAARLVRGASRWARPARWAGCGLAAAVLAVLGARTWSQCHIYRDLETLWLDTIAKNPDGWMAYHNLAFLRVQQGRTEEAVARYRQAIERKPDDFEAHAAMGALLLSQGRTEEAAAYLREALRINPDCVNAYNNLGMLLSGQGRASEAIDCYLAALHRSPEAPDVLSNLASLLLRQGQIDSAIEHYRRAAQADPARGQTHLGLAAALSRKGDLAGAEEHLAQVVRLDPNSELAHLNLGKILSRRGRPAEAAKQYRDALRLNPDLLEAMYNLAWLLATSEDAKLRNGAEAVQLAERLCVLTQCDSAQGLDAMAAAYAEVGEFSKAIRFAKAALQLAQGAGGPGLAAEIEARLRLYEAGKCYREKAAPSTNPAS